jgi:O-antigen ligase
MNESINHRIDKGFSALLIISPCVCLAFPVKVCTYLIVIIIAGWLYFTLREKSLFRFRGMDFLVALPFLNYLILIVGLITTSDYIMGFKSLETKIPLLFFPLIFFSGHDFLQHIRKNIALLTYATAISLICVYVLVYVFVHPPEDAAGYSFKSLAGVINVHPGYFSLYVGFAIIVFVLHWQSFDKPVKVIVAFAIVFLFVFNLLLVARMPMIGLMISLLIYLIYGKKYKLMLLIVATVVLFILSVGYRNPDWSQRIIGPAKMIINGDLEQLQFFAYDRMQETTCTFELFFNKGYLFTGYGTGDDKTELLRCYAGHGYDWIRSQQYNAHNQYFQSTLQNGLISGLLCFFLIAAPLLFKTISTANVDFLLFSISFGVFSFTESTLEVQKGLIFFSFFYSLFVYYSHSSVGRQIEKIETAE